MATSPARAAPPTVAGTFSARPTPVFDTKTDSCEKIDVPDANPRAFRDARNRVHLVSTHYVARAMVGDSLDTVARDCRVLYRSPEDPDPSHFSGRSWPMSFFSLDGRRIAALMHTEYEAWTVPPAVDETPSRSLRGQGCG